MGGVGGTKHQTPVTPTVLATLAVAGGVVPALPPIPAQRMPRDLRGAVVADRRELIQAMGMGGGGMRFSVDGKTFDPDRGDQAVRVGSIDEWRVTNTSPVGLPLHLHVRPCSSSSAAGNQWTQRPGWTS